MLQALHKKLFKAQTAVKVQADKKRMEVSYSIGDWVYIRFFPYHQTSVSRMTYTKLAKRFMAHIK